MRPVLAGAIQAADGSWQEAEFLVDVAADRTVFSAEMLAALGLPTRATRHQLGGVGGSASAVLVETQIRLAQQDGSPLLFRGEYAAFTELAALDMSVLGRDITNLFAVIVDRPGDAVLMLAQRHGYAIQHR